MEQQDVDTLFASVAKTDRNNYCFDRIEPLLDLIESREIRDFSLCCSPNSLVVDGLYSRCSCGTCLISAIHGLCRCTCFAPTGSSELVRIFSSIFGISDIPEFENVLLMSKFDRKFYEEFVKCHFIVHPDDARDNTKHSASGGEKTLISTQSDAKSDTSGKLSFASVVGSGTNAAVEAKCLLYARRLMHYVYKNAADSSVPGPPDSRALPLRAFFREVIYTALVEGVKVVGAIKPALVGVRGATTNSLVRACLSGGHSVSASLRCSTC
jgi:hypothetical protein